MQYFDFLSYSNPDGIQYQKQLMGFIEILHQDHEYIYNILTIKQPIEYFYHHQLWLLKVLFMMLPLYECALYE